MKKPEDLFTVEAAALEKSVTREAIYQAIERGVIQPEPINGEAVVIRRSELEKYRPRWGGKRPGAGRRARPKTSGYVQEEEEPGPGKEAGL